MIVKDFKQISIFLIAMLILFTIQSCSRSVSTPKQTEFKVRKTEWVTNVNCEKNYSRGPDYYSEKNKFYYKNLYQN